MENYQNAKVVLGLMRITTMSDEEVYQLIKGALDLGIHYFDTADFYGHGKSEEKIGHVLKAHPELRSQMFIQTKCGLVPSHNGDKYLDLSYEHIKEALSASLERMNLDYVDSFLLHRVDIFMDNKEIAKAISELYKEGKIHHFGISNMDVEIIKYLQEYLDVPIEVDQLQVSLGQPALLSQPFNVNFPQQKVNISDGLFFYLKRKHIALQCWSPYQIGFFEGSIFNEERLPKLNAKLEELAKKYHSTKCGIATSFLAMLTPDISIVTGATKLDYIKETLEGAKLVMSKEDWYDLYSATENMLP